MGKTKRMHVFIVIIAIAIVLFSACGIETYQTVLPSTVFPEESMNQHTPAETGAYRFTTPYLSNTFGLDTPPESSSKSKLGELSNFTWLCEESISTIDNGATQIDMRHCYYNSCALRDGCTDISVNIDLVFPYISGNDAATTANDAISSLIYYQMGEGHIVEWLKTFDAYLKDENTKNFDVFSYNCSVNCEITYLSERLVSVHFQATRSDSTRLNLFADFLTISLSSGAVLTINDVFSQNEVVDTLEQGRFTIEVGMASPDGWQADDNEIRKIISEIIIEAITDNITLNEMRGDAFSLTEFAMLSETEALLKVDYFFSLDNFVIIRLQIA